MKLFRKTLAKPLSIVTLFSMTVSMLIPVNTFSISGGPNQPEASGYTAAGTGEMVDPFTGDFKYNIPLMDVGGYPIGLNYAAGISPDDEASWVGLGWNLNVGSINRSLRGIADDYAGDNVVTEHTMKPNQTYGVSFSPATQGTDDEAATFKYSITQNYNIFYNNYNGFGFSYSYSPSLDMAILSSSGDNPFDLGVSAGVDLSIGSEDGVGINPRVGLKTGFSGNNTESSYNARIGFPYSSREGAKGMTMSSSFNISTSNEVTKSHKSPTDKKSKETYSSTFENSTSSTIGSSSFKGFSTPTYPTTINHDMYAVNVATSFTYEDSENIGRDKTQFGTGGTYSGQFEVNKESNNKAYGFMYEGLSNDPESIMDFNREKESGFNLETTNLPLTNHTYDIFAVSGAGIGGSFRLFRNDVVTVGDNRQSNTTDSPDIGVGVALGVDDPAWNHFKIAVDFKFVDANSESGRWKNGFMQTEQNPKNRINQIRQNTYFGQIGDPSPENNPDFYNNTLLSDKLYDYKFKSGLLSGVYQDKQGNDQPGFIRTQNNDSERYTRNIRRNRANVFTYLTALQAANTSNNKFIYNHITHDNIAQNKIDEVNNDDAGGIGNEVKTINDQNIVSPIYTDFKEITRNADYRKNDHLSEISVTNSEGKRYVYGIPVYNKTQEEATFSVNTNDIENARKTGLVDFTPEEASIGNKSGLENYYQKTILPSYASSFLLTQILSSDYVDSDNIPGPSDGDLGTYVKFNYTRTSDDYRWRTPFEGGMANFADGLAGKENDDKGSFTYGEKELWYLHSIETRTHVAEFHLKDRLDGFGVIDNNGGLSKANKSTQKYLEKIVLYSKRDMRFLNPEPLKTVHFDYNYELCPGTPNSTASCTVDGEVINNGKLTLKHVHFTYGNSEKGKENPYEFSYKRKFTNTDGSQQPYVYNSKFYDRWVCYKEQASDIGNEEFPYTIQDNNIVDGQANLARQRSITDEYVAAFCMNRILTPNGGDIRVHYESDDYGYVQNKQAMRMFKTLGVNEDVPDNGASIDDRNYSDELYDGGGPVDEKLWLFVDLADGISSDLSQSEALSYFRSNYINDIENLHYRANVKIVNNSLDNNGRETFETFPGYSKFDNVRVFKKGSNNYNVAAIRLKKESLKQDRTNKNLHPFVKNAWLYGRLQYNRELQGSTDAGANGFFQVLGALISASKSVIGFTFGFKNQMILDGNGRFMNPEKSFVRLYEADKIKLGGGHRVRAIVMFDRWDEMVSDREKVDAEPKVKEIAGYGQVYDYTMLEGEDTISSGIAAYEPIIGGEENPWRTLTRQTIDVPLAPDREFYSEEPYGESFFPAPTVGYRKVVTTPVKVVDKNYDPYTLETNGTGYVEEEFFTAYDFPTFVSSTAISVDQDKSAPTINPLKFQSSDFVYCSQGYMVELNDMHGKPKSKTVFADAAAEDESPVSSVRYEYNVRDDQRNKLDCQVNLVDNQLNVLNESGRELGTTIDVVNDTRYYNSEVVGGGADINVRLSLGKSFPTPPTFVPIISAFPDANIESLGFFSIVTTKVVNRYGILKKTIVSENGQNIATDNLAWDAETGNVLLTKVENEFHNDIYNFTYPAHWAYEAMGLGYQNEGYEFNKIFDRKLEGNEIVRDEFTPVTDNLFDGDEIIAFVAAGRLAPGIPAKNERHFVYYDKEKNTLSGKNGGVLGRFTWAKVVRSGARNIANVPIGSVSSLKNPLVGNKISFENKSILNTGATEFKNIWKKFCNCGEQERTNPFVTGEKGQLRAWRSWTYLTGRTQNGDDGELDIRNDGDLEDYQTFWHTGSAFLTPQYEEVDEMESKWQFVTEVENFNPVGQEIENKDALERFSMAQFGYGRNLPVGVSNNSEYRETGFDGFEDYDYGDCNDDHFSWRSRVNDTNTGLTDDESHTGKSSYRVNGNSSSKIIKKLYSECIEEEEEKK